MMVFMFPRLNAGRTLLLLIAPALFTTVAGAVLRPRSNSQPELNTGLSQTLRTVLVEKMFHAGATPK
jgi:hypothetical protein